MTIQTPQNIESRDSTQRRFPHDRSSTTHKNREEKTAQMSIKGWTDKQNSVQRNITQP